MKTYGFVRPQDQGLRKRSNLASSVPNGVDLISKSDIYCNSGPNGAGQTLLLKSGHAVDETLLVKLVRFGVEAKDFCFVQNPDSPTHLPQQSETSLRGATAQKPMAKQPKLELVQKNAVLVVDSDSKGQERLSRCLVALGVPLASLHPVRVQAHLLWALQKYQPSFIFIDANLHFNKGAYSSKQTHGFKMLEALSASGFNMNHVVFIMPESTQLAPPIRQQLLKLAYQLGVRVVFKPVTRYALLDVMDDVLSQLKR